MNFRVAIVEDNPEASNQLGCFLTEYGKQRNCNFSVSVYGDALDFLENFRGNFDMIFMDIELPHLNGMDAAKRIREKDKKVIVIFVTNMAQYAVKGYEVDALDFIVKPLVYSGFAMKLDRAVERFNAMQDKYVWINDYKNKRRLLASEIKYIEVVHHSVVYHTVSGKFTTYDQLKNILETFENLPFALCNRCYLVNLNYVTAIDEYCVTVAGEKLQISRNKKKSFLLSLNEHLGGK